MESGELDIGQFKSWHDEAFLYINQAMTQEKPNINRPDVALMMYQKGLGLLDQSLCFDIEGGQGPEWEKAKKMQEKMSKTRIHVSDRIIQLTDILAPPSPPEQQPPFFHPPRPPPPKTCRQTNQPERPPPPHANLPERPPPPQRDCPERPNPPSMHPPSYHSVLSSDNERHGAPPSYLESEKAKRPYGDVQSALDEIGELDSDPTFSPSQPGATRNMKKSSSELHANRVELSSIRRSASSDSVSSAEQGEILFSIENVQVFRVTEQGEVSTPSYPETLHIVKFSDEQRHRGGAPAFIEIGSWTYPLVPGKSPVLHASFGGYMFPDLEASEAGASVGIVIPEAVTQTDRDILESLLSELTTAFKTQEQVEEEYKEYREFTSNVASGLVKGAEVVGRGMVKGAVKTSEYMFHGADYAKQYITPDGVPRPVDPNLRQGLEAARWVSSGAVRVSGWMVNKVGCATMALGRLVAPHLQRGAQSALTHVTKQSDTEASNQLAIVGELAAGTVAAVSTVYLALENSSKILAKNIANNTVMIVSHKYGTDMAAVTDSALATVGNSYLTIYNAGALGPKGIAKRTAKDAGKAMVGVNPDEIVDRANKAQDAPGGLLATLPPLALEKGEKNKENQEQS